MTTLQAVCRVPEPTKFSCLYGWMAIRDHSLTELVDHAKLFFNSRRPCGAEQMVQEMFERSEKELEFFRRVFDSDVFQEIFGSESASSISNEFSKDNVLNAIKSMLRSDFDDEVRRRCLEAMGRICCQMFLEYSGLVTDTDINTYAASLKDYLSEHTCTKVAVVADYIIVEHSPGKQGNAAKEACRCPIIVRGDVELTPEWCVCGRSFQQTMYESIVKQPVDVELMDSPLTTNSDRCRWLILLRPPQ